MWRTPENTIVQNDQPYVDAEGTQYPGNFYKGDIPGMLPITLTPKPTPFITQSLVPGGIEFVGGVWREKWSLRDWSVVEIAGIFISTKAGLMQKIDTDNDAIIRAVIGDRASQYEGAEQEAQAYKAAGYTGTVPPKVQAWATAKGKSAQWAADSQVATALQWRHVDNQMYAMRLLRKEQVRNATTLEDVQRLSAQWAGFVAATKTALAI